MLLSGEAGIGKSRILETMRERGFNVTPAVERRMAESLHYAVTKARRRGLKRLPGELVPYLAPPAGTMTF